MPNPMMEENAIIYCEGALNSLDGKATQALIRSSERYKVIAVIDSTHEGMDAGKVLDGKKRKIPVVRNLGAALDWAAKKEVIPHSLIIGMSIPSGPLSEGMEMVVQSAIDAGMNIYAGFQLVPEILKPFAGHIKLPNAGNLEFPAFSGKIQGVTALKIAVLGTDHGVGKHTTAWLMTKTLQRQGIPAQLIGTSLTSWLRGGNHGIFLEAVPKGNQAGALEDAAFSAWKTGARVLIFEGYGSLLHPSNPGGTEILNAIQPDLVVLQHAANRTNYWGWPSYKIHSLSRQAKAIEVLAGRPVDALAVNPGWVDPKEGRKTVKKLAEKTGLPAWDVVAEGAEALVAHLMNLARNLPPKSK
jgi:uncharacterized NAD-dependent epimerase/dehydratase family protein